MPQKITFPLSNFINRAGGWKSNELSNQLPT